jgi:predicted O-methyltransferase YrrM
MKPALKLDVLICHFPYGGNGGVSSEIPQIRQWELQTVLKMKQDERIGEIYTQDFSDTPITMTRNRAVKHAKKIGAHLVLFVDSDNDPLRHAKEPWHKPFWDEAFNFVYKNYHKGPHVVGAPYCGPPNGIENIYVFHWESYHNRGEESLFKLEQYSRQQAAMMSGIQECAALPTGMILYDVRAFDLIEPEAVSKRSVLEDVQTGRRTVEEAMLALREGYFYYEWADCHADEKASTEDVTNTRDIALAGMQRLGYNPIHCAWDSWVGHQKPMNVGKPQFFGTKDINASFEKAVLAKHTGDERIIDVASLNQGDDPISRRLRGMAADALQQHNANGNGKYTTEKSWREYGHACKEHVAALAVEVAHRDHWPDGRKPRALEVGSWLGTTAIAMADAGAIVHCVDTWQGSPTDITSACVEDAGGQSAVFEEFKSNVGARLNRTIFAHARTSHVASQYHWEPFDLIFIDAEHTYEAVKADILAWWKHLRDDGVMIGHDYFTKQYPGVNQAVEELFGDKVETIGESVHGAMWKVKKSDFPNGLKEADHAGTLATHSY